MAFIPIAVPGGAVSRIPSVAKHERLHKTTACPLDVGFSRLLQVPARRVFHGHPKIILGALTFAGEAFAVSASVSPGFKPSLIFHMAGAPKDVPMSAQAILSKLIDGPQQAGGPSGGGPAQPPKTGGGGDGDDEDDGAHWVNWNPNLFNLGRDMSMIIVLSGALVFISIVVDFLIPASWWDTVFKPLLELFSAYLRTGIVFGIAYFVQPFVHGYVSHILGKAGIEHLGDVKESVNYTMTVLGLVYAIMIGQTYNDACSKQDMLKIALYKEASNLETFVILGLNLNQGKDLRAKRAVLGGTSEYVSCVLEKDFGMNVVIDSPCVQRLRTLSLDVAAIADDGKGDKTDRVTMDSMYEALSNALDARTERIFASDSRISPNHKMRLRLCGASLLFGGLVHSSDNAFLDRVMFGTLATSMVVLDSVVRDLADWTWGEYSVDSKPFESLKERCTAMLQALEPPALASTAVAGAAAASEPST